MSTKEVKKYPLTSPGQPRPKQVEPVRKPLKPLPTKK